MLAAHETGHDHSAEQADTAKQRQSPRAAQGFKNLSVYRDGQKPGQSPLGQFKARAQEHNAATQKKQRGASVEQMSAQARQGENGLAEERSSQGNQGHSCHLRLGNR